MAFRAQLPYHHRPDSLSLAPFAQSHPIVSSTQPRSAMAVPSPDVQAIANLLKRERYYRDTAQWNDCRATFHPHASQTYVNVAWLVALVGRLGPRPRLTFWVGMRATSMTSYSSRLVCTRARSTSFIRHSIPSTSTSTEPVRPAKRSVWSPVPSQLTVSTTS